MYESIGWHNDLVEQGVVVLRNFFTPAETTEMEAGYDEMSDAIASDLKRSNRFIFGSSLPLKIRYLWRHAGLIELAKQCLKSENIALYMNRCLLKDKDWNGPVTIHQDMPYFHGSQNKLTVFLSLTPIQADGGNGGLKFVLGSHKFGQLQRGAIKREIFPKMLDLSPSLNTCDLILMDFLTWHYSEAAITADDRCILQIAYQRSDDGSYATEMFGVPKPTLVSGQWLTDRFVPLNDCVIPDA